MAKLTSMETITSIERRLHLDKIMAGQPMRKLILGDSLGFKNSSYGDLKKQRKNGAWIVREAYLLDNISSRAMRRKIMRPNGAGKSNESFIFTREWSHKAYLTSYRVISSLIAYLSFLWIQRLSIPCRFTSYAVVTVVITTTALFLKLLQNPKYWKWLINLFKGTKCVKDKLEEISKPHKTTSAAPKPKWSLIDTDLLFSLDVYRFENFVIVMSILLAWAVLRRLYFFFRRLYPKNDRK